MATELQIETKARAIYAAYLARMPGQPAWDDLADDDQRKVTALARAADQLANG